MRAARSLTLGFGRRQSFLSPPDQTSDDGPLELLRRAAAVVEGGRP